MFTKVTEAVGKVEIFFRFYLHLTSIKWYFWLLLIRSLLTRLPPLSTPCGTSDSLVLVPCIRAQVSKFEFVLVLVWYKYFIINKMLLKPLSLTATEKSNKSASCSLLGTELIHHPFCAGKDDTQKRGQEGESSLKLWHKAPWTTTATSSLDGARVASQEGVFHRNCTLEWKKRQTGQMPKRQDRLAAQKSGE